MKVPAANERCHWHFSDRRDGQSASPCVHTAKYIMCTPTGKSVVVCGYHKLPARVAGYSIEAIPF